MIDGPLEGVLTLAVGLVLSVIVGSDFREGRLTYAKGRWLERAEFPHIVWPVHVLFGSVGMVSIVMGCAMLIRDFA